MAAIEVEIVTKKVKSENTRLAARLEEANKWILLLEKYRKCLTVLVNNCKCCQSGESRVEFSVLEDEYECMARERSPTRADDEADSDAECGPGVDCETSGDAKAKRKRNERNKGRVEYEVKRGVRVETNGKYEPKRSKSESADHLSGSEISVDTETEFDYKPKKWLKSKRYSDSSANDQRVIVGANSQQCGRDSFDRFGDHFCERVVSYLPVGDCFESECVSRVWSSTVYNHQKRLDIGLLIKQFRSRSEKKREIALNILGSVLRKYARIEDVVISCAQIDSRMIDIIRDNVSALKSVFIKGFTYELSSKSWQLFCEKIGPDLRNFIVDFDCIAGEYRMHERKVNTLFQLTPNLIECQIERLNQCVRRDGDCDDFLPKLKTITARYTSEMDFEPFADQYSNRVQKLSISTPQLRDHSQKSAPERPHKEHIVSMFHHLSRLERLESLYIEFMEDTNYENVKNSMNLIANKCQQLRELTLSGDNLFVNIFNSDSVNASHSYQHFIALTRLTLIETNTLTSIEDLKYLACFPNLVKLELHATDIKTLNLTGIHSCVPKLQSFRFDSSLRVNDETLKQLTKLEDLVSIGFKMVCDRLTAPQITDTDLHDLIDSCAHMRRIELPDVLSVTKTTLNLLISRAELNRKRQFLLRTVVRKHDNINKSDYNKMHNNLPKNLEFDIGFYEERKLRKR